MKKISENNHGQVFEREDGVKVGIFKDVCMGHTQYFNVCIDKPEWKYGKTVATRCTYQKALAIGELYEQ